MGTDSEVLHWARESIPLSCETWDIRRNSSLDKNGLLLLCFAFCQACSASASHIYSVRGGQAYAARDGQSYTLDFWQVLFPVHPCLIRKQAHNLLWWAGAPSQGTWVLCERTAWAWRFLLWKYIANLTCFTQTLNFYILIFLILFYIKQTLNLL